MLSNKIFIYNLCFGLSKLYTNIQQDQKAKLDYHMSMLGRGGGAGVGLDVLKCFVRGDQNFFLLAFCVCVVGGGGGGRSGSVPLLP